MNHDSLLIDMVNSDGTLDTENDCEFTISKIRVITFETDYHTSVRLLWRYRLNAKDAKV